MGALVSEWLDTSSALPGRRTLLARDKTIIAVVAYGDVPVSALIALRWGDVCSEPDAAITWRRFGHTHRSRNSSVLRAAMQRWHDEMQTVIGRPIRPDDPVFPLLRKVRLRPLVRLAPLAGTSMFHVVRIRLEEARVPSDQCKVDVIRGLLADTASDCTPAPPS